MTRDEVLGVVKKHIFATLDEVEGQDLDLDRSMVDYGANSLDIIEIVSSSMRDLHIKVPRTELQELHNINQLVDLFLRYVNQPQPSA